MSRTTTTASPLLLLLLLLLVVQVLAVATDGDVVRDLPGLSASDSATLVQYAARIALPAPSRSSLFYWFVGVNNSAISMRDAPIVVWLNGGPACSSLTGLFVENGPFAIREPTYVMRSSRWRQHVH
jgi:hypothetical protein